MVAGGLSGSDNIITLGDGVGDMVTAFAESVRGNIITLGDGAGDSEGLSALESLNNKITLGNGAGDTVNVSGCATTTQSPSATAPVTR